MPNKYSSAQKILKTVAAAIFTGGCLATFLSSTADNRQLNTSIGSDLSGNVICGIELNELLVARQKTGQLENGLPILWGILEESFSTVQIQDTCLRVAASVILEGPAQQVAAADAETLMREQICTLLRTERDLEKASIALGVEMKDIRDKICLPSLKSPHKYDQDNDSAPTYTI